MGSVGKHFRAGGFVLRGGSSGGSERRGTEQKGAMGEPEQSTALPGSWQETQIVSCLF